MDADANANGDAGGSAIALHELCSGELIIAITFNALLFYARVHNFCFLPTFLSLPFVSLLLGPVSKSKHPTYHLKPSICF